MSFNIEQHLKEIKRTKTRLGSALNLTLPMVEEVVEKKLHPLCLIGFRAGKKGEKHSVHFATLHDEHDSIVYRACKAFVTELAHKYEPKTETP